MDLVEKIVREACARSPDGKISSTDFSVQASRSMRYGTFSPMEVAIIFNYAGQGSKSRLGLKDFAQLLDPKWGPPKAPGKKVEPKGSFMHELGKVCSTCPSRTLLTDLPSPRTTLRSVDSLVLVSRLLPDLRSGTDAPQSEQQRCTRSTWSRPACRTSAPKWSESCCTRTR